MKPVSIKSVTKRNFFHFDKIAINMRLPSHIAVFSESSQNLFPSFPQSLFQSETKCEIFVMIISYNFNMNEN